MKINKYPEGISNGLSLPCYICEEHTILDYTVRDEFWRTHVPKEYQTWVICIGCLDDIVEDSELIARNLERVQLCLAEGTIVLKPTKSYIWKNYV